MTSELTNDLSMTAAVARRQERLQHKRLWHNFNAALQSVIDGRPGRADATEDLLDRFAALKQAGIQGSIDIHRRIPQS